MNGIDLIKSFTLVNSANVTFNNFHWGSESQRVKKSVNEDVIMCTLFPCYEMQKPYKTKMKSGVMTNHSSNNEDQLSVQRVVNSSSHFFPRIKVKKYDLGIKSLTTTTTRDIVGVFRFKRKTFYWWGIWCSSSFFLCFYVWPKFLAQHWRITSTWLLWLHKYNVSSQGWILVLGNSWVSSIKYW